MAYLFTIPALTCRKPNCDKRARVKLIDQNDRYQGDYCKSHGRAALKTLKYLERKAAGAVPERGGA